MNAKLGILMLFFLDISKTSYPKPVFKAKKKMQSFWVIYVDKLVIVKLHYHSEDTFEI